MCTGLTITKIMLKCVDFTTYMNYLLLTAQENNALTWKVAAPASP